MNRAGRPLLAASVVAAMGLLGACTSQPSPKAVAIDVVESLPGLTEAERQCMLDVIDGYTSDELKAIGKANESESITTQGDGTPEMQKFTADLGNCTAAG